MDQEIPQSDPAPDQMDAAALPEDAGEDLIAVGIGASAGGLEAFSELLRYLPPFSGMAFLLVQHLDPHHTSALPELLAGKTRMPVRQVENETRIEPDHIYVIPPNTVMRVRDRTLVLEARPEKSERFRPIDTLFQSLAEQFRFNSVGIVLSGTASDGTLGLKAIKVEGGITFAQNQTAKFDSMPRSAIAAGVVDFVLSPRRIAEELAAIANRTLHLSTTENDLVGDGKALYRVMALLRSATGVNFTQYKQATVLRRLHRRMVVRKSEDLDQYVGILQKEPDEVRSLFDEILINVTSFFRDPEVFETAKRLVFPAMLRERRPPYSVRAWAPGCSSGEEVYSLAIALVEFFASEDMEYSIQLFGTDISESAIEKARAGHYDENAVVNVAPERLRRFFSRTESGYQINRAIREMCIFSRHNVANDPPLSRMDLISCRNLLIYLAPSLQRRILARLGYALQPHGCLILGASETLGALAQHFYTIDEPHRIYCRKASIPPGIFSLAEIAPDYPPSPLPPPPPPPPPPAGQASDTHALHTHVNRMVLSRYSPAGVVADESLRVIEIRGDMDPFLVNREEEQGAELMNAVRQEFRAPLSTALEQARRTQSVVVAEGAVNGSIPVVLTVIPLTLTGVRLHFFILFGPGRETYPAPAEPAPPAEDPDAPPLPVEQEVQQLKQELKASREYLQAVIEELRSTNEEAQSANEELQSTNEEVQTSKEELQSSNEELNTINAEMESRNSDLARMNDDLINLLGSMNMPIVMTGSDLRIRRFTPMAERVLRLISTDVGRPIADLKPRINVPNLEVILRQVVDTLEPYEREVEDDDGRLYLMRVRAYRTADHRIDGTVLQLVDISDLKRSMEEVRHARDYAESVVNTVREPLVVFDRSLRIVNVNRAFHEALGEPESATVGQGIFEAARGLFDRPEVRRVIELLNRGAREFDDLEIRLRPEHGEPRVLSLNARRLRTTGEQGLILMAVEDVTERKRAAEARYRRLFESARDGIVLVDAGSGEILDLNPYTERLLGYNRLELVGRKLWEIEPIRDLPRVRAAIEHIGDKGVARFDDLILHTRDGQQLHAEVIANVYSEGDRRAIQFNMRDVSERKRFERELLETQKLESLGLLAGGIAHDFNNLLTGILGNASLALAEAPADQPLRIRLREVIQASERAAFLTRQMLAYSGRGRFVIEPIDVGDLVREISVLVRTSIPKTVELKLNLAPNLPQIEADTAQIQQVIMNLVINGAEAIGEDAPGKVEVRTSAREIDAREAAELFGPELSEPGTYVVIEVIDTGAGMDDSTKARIFDPFFTTKFTGRGLGLAAVQGIVRGHHGTIRVYSTPGHGTTFLVLLPAARRRHVAAEPASRPPRAIPEGSVALVVDDEQTIRDLARNVLTRAGMRVLTADNGQEGAAMFREHRGLISVVILDLLMPVMGGEEALVAMQQIDPTVPVIASSGFDESEAAQRFEDHKPTRFLQKPYTAERLVEAVASTLSRPKR